MRCVALLALATACSSSLQEPAPLSQIASRPASGRGHDELICDANAAWAHRDTPGKAAAAQALYLDAAAADPARVDGLLGAMRAITYRIEREQGVAREDLARKGVELGQWCHRRAPKEPECDYRLAIALGQLAREKPSTGMDALGKMVELLHRAIAAAPRLDSAGPHRVLALVLMRAPSWPIGPGDPEEGLAEAKKAAQLYPDAADNQLALAEGLAATGSREGARTAYGKALALATAARDAGDPDAASVMEQARTGLAHVSGH